MSLIDKLLDEGNCGRVIDRGKEACEWAVKSTILVRRRLHSRQNCEAKDRDRRPLKLIGRYLQAGVMVEGVFQPTVDTNVSIEQPTTKKSLQRMKQSTNTHFVSLR